MTKIIVSIYGAMAKRAGVFVLLALLSIGSVAQTFSPTVQPSLGGFLTGGNLQLQYTIGESLNQTFNAGGYEFSLGFGQPQLNIVVGDIPTGPFCVGAQISVPFTTKDLFSANTFTAVLSDSSGNFDSPFAYNIGVDTVPGSDTIIATMPSGITGGTHYRIRVVASYIGFVGGASTSFEIIQLNAIAASGGSYCSYDTINLSASPNGLTSYAWSGPDSFSSTSQNPKLAASGNAGSYTLTVSDTYGCSATATTTVAVNSPPTNITPTAENDTICPLSSTNINIASSLSGINYVLLLGDSTILSSGLGTGGTLALPTGAILVNAAFIVTQTDTATLCSVSSSEVPVIVSAPVFVSGDTLLCAGGTSCYSAIAPNGDSVKYSIVYGGATIDSITGCVSNVTSSFVVSAVTATGCDGLGGTRSVTVPIIGRVVAPVPFTLCGDTAQTVSFQNILAGANANAIEWASDSLFTSPYYITSYGSINITVNPGSDTMLWLMSVDTVSGCVSIPVASHAVIHSGPTLETTYSSASYVCSGTSATIIMPSSQNGIQYFFSWPDSAIIAFGNGDTLQFTSGALTANTIFNLLAVDTTNGCATQFTNDTVAVGIPTFALPTTLVCAGSSSCFTATAPGGAGIIYTITGGAVIDSFSGCVSAVTDSFTVTATSTVAGCSTAISQMGVQVTSVSALTVSSSFTACGDSTFYLTISGINVGTGGDHIEWAFNSTFANSDTLFSPASLNLILSADTTVWVRSISNSTGCVSSAVTSHITTSSRPIAAIYPADTILGGNDSLILQATGGYTYHWPLSGSDSSFIIAKPNGDTTIYTAFAINAQGCIDTVFARLVTKDSLFTGNISDSSVCAGSSIRIPFVAFGSFALGNVFIAQLSDSSGSFAVPINIGTDTNLVFGSDTVLAILPNDIVGGNSYKVRVISALPSIVANSSSAFTVKGFGANIYPIVLNDSICPGASVDVAIPESQIGKIYQLMSNLDSIITGYGTGDTLVFSAPSVTADKDFYVLATDTFTGCTIRLPGEMLVHVMSGNISYKVVGTDSVQFETSDRCGGSWLWSFPGATSVSSYTSPKPFVTYGVDSIYTAYLTTVATSGDTMRAHRSFRLGRSAGDFDAYVVPQSLTVCTGNTVTVMIVIRDPSCNGPYTITLNGVTASLKALYSGIRVDPLDDYAASDLTYASYVFPVTANTTVTLSSVTDNSNSPATILQTINGSNAVAVFAPIVCCKNNLVTDGDFNDVTYSSTAVNPIFGSELNYEDNFNAISTSNTPGNYSIYNLTTGLNPGNQNVNWFTYSDANDNCQNLGYSLAIDGVETPPATNAFNFSGVSGPYSVVWSQNLTINAHSTYRLSFNVLSCDQEPIGTGPATSGFSNVELVGVLIKNGQILYHSRIYGDLASRGTNYPDENGINKSRIWTQADFQAWNSGTSSGPVTLQIWQVQYFGYFGTDYALDNITFAWVNSPPAIQLVNTYPDCTNDPIGQISVTTTGGTAPYSYNWSGSGSGSNPRTNLNAGDYTVDVTDAIGCSASATDVLPISGACCTGDPGLIWGSKGGPHMGTYTFGSTGSTTKFSDVMRALHNSSHVLNMGNTKIVFYGEIDVDDDYAILGSSNVNFAPGASLVVGSSIAKHTLYILNSTLKACRDELWAGVFTQFQGPNPTYLMANPSLYSVVMNANSTIEDALVGIRCSDKGRYSVIASHFVNDFAGISGYFLDNTAEGVRQIWDNTFTYTRPGLGILPSYPGAQYTVVQGTNPSAGVSFLYNSVTQDVGNSGHHNVFSYLNCGIVAIDASVASYKSTFLYMMQHQSSPANTYVGTGWCAYGIDDNNHNGQPSPFWLKIYGPGKTDAIVFDQVQNGIFARNMNLLVDNNNMHNFVYGSSNPMVDVTKNTAIVADVCVADQILVTSNTIDNAFHGVSLLNNSRANQYVFFNHIEMGDVSNVLSPPIANSGIAVSYFTNLDNNFTQIDSNYIQNGRAGIYVENAGTRNTSTFRIMENVISMPSLQRYNIGPNADPAPFTNNVAFNKDLHGIYLNFCFGGVFPNKKPSFLVSDNNIYGTSGSRSYLVYRKCGITLEESLRITVQCNNMSDVGIGLHIKGNDDNTFLYNNAFGFYPDDLHSNNYHMVLRTMPVFSPDHALMGAIGSPSTCNSNTFSNNLLTIGSYTANFIHGNLEPFYDDNTLPFKLAPNNSDFHNLPLLVNPLNGGEGFHEAACSTIPTSPPYTINDPGVIDASLAGSIISGTSYDDYPSRHAFVGVWLQKRRLFREIGGDSLAFNTDTLYRNFYDSLKNTTAGQFELFDSVIGTLSDSDKVGDSKFFSSIRGIALDINSGISATYTYETNEQYINDLYLNTLALGVDSFSAEDSAFIITLAQKCPLVGGAAVYKARAFYRAFNPNAWFDDNYVCRSTAMEHESNHRDTTAAINIAQQNMSFKLVPNPAHNSCVLFYQIPSDTKANFALYNSVGQLVQTNEITGAGQLLAIETGNLLSGIYLCRVANGSGTLYSNKLVIVK